MGDTEDSLSTVQRKNGPKESNAGTGSRIEMVRCFENFVSD